MFRKTCLIVFSIAFMVYGGLSIPVKGVDAFFSSITINNVSLTLQNDVNGNGIVNIGDQIGIDLTVSNTDGGCTADTTATANLTAYGGGAGEALACITDNGGVADVMSISFLVADAGGSGIDVGAADAASQVNVVTADSNEILGPNANSNSMAQAVDTIAPTFETISAFLQDGSLPAVATNNWYYFSPDQDIRFGVQSNDALSIAEVCIQSLLNDSPMDMCSVSGPNDFETGTEGVDFVSYTNDLGGNAYEFIIPISGLSLPPSFPSTPGGYVMNMAIVDDAGNVTYSTDQSTSFGAVVGINPYNTTILNNANTTDWSTIEDFTSVSPLVFSAEDENGLLGRITLNGPLNLTAQATIDALTNLGNNMTVNGDVIRIDSGALAAFNNGAELKMHVESAVQPGLIVKDNGGNIEGYVGNSEASGATVGSRTLDGFSWDGDLQILTFNTDGFSEFDTDFTPPTLLSARISGPNELTLVFSEAVAGNASDFTDFRISGEESGRFISGISGGGTDTVLLTFDGDAAGSDATGTIDINYPVMMSVTDMVGNELGVLDDQPVTDGQGASAAVYVDDDFSGAADAGGHIWGYDAFATIQNGINAVSTGGTVYVAAGSYTGNLSINNAMTLQGESSTTVTVTAPAASHGFDVSANNVTISGFTITGATGSGGGGKGGINVNAGVDYLALSDNILTGNRYGIKTKGTITNLSAESNSINNNSVYGIYILKGTSVDVATWAVHENSFSSNGSYNIYREGIGILNAEKNWWDTDVKSGIKDSLYSANAGNVDIVPFYTDAEKTILSPLSYTLTVCTEVCDYTTIQDAINNSDYEASTTGTSNIIEVYAGNYPGAISMTKPVNLRGPNADINPISGERAAEAILDGTLPLINMTTDGVANVTINGFKLIGTTAAAVAGAIHSNKLNAHNVTIRDNIFSGSEGRSIFASQGAAGVYRNNWLVTENIFENMDPATNPFQAGMMIHSIQNSSITNNQISSTSYGGIQLGHSSSTVISGNTVTNVPRAGIEVAYSSGITIEDNTIANAGNGAEMTDVRGFGAHTDDMTENGGITIYNADQTDLTITGNTISGSYNGIAVRNDGGLDAPLGSGIIANENSITGSVNFAAENLSSSQLSAEHNYWGSASPDFGAIISGDVDYAPWWITATGTDSEATKSITNFTIAGQVGTTTIDESAHTITVVVPFATDVTALAPTITHNGISVSPASGAAQDFTAPQAYTVTAFDTLTQDYTVTVTVLSDTQTAPDNSGDATLDADTPEVIIVNPDQEVDLTVASSTANPSIDLGAFIAGGTGDIPKITITAENAGDVVVSIPATTITSTDVGWDGVLAAPTITTVTLPETTGQTKTLSTAIELGFSGAKLSFDNAVRILFPGQAGKRVGYVRTGITFTEITAVCAADNQATGDALAVDGDCKKDVGGDLIIWTKHFTSFATYTQTQNSTGGSSGGGYQTADYTFKAPTSGVTIKVNNGSANTTARVVALDLYGGADAKNMAISNSADFVNAAQEPYNTVKTWTLTEGNGVKTVYVKFYNQYGYSSAAVSGMITLSGQAADQTVSAPSETVQPPANAISNFESAVVFSHISTASIQPGTMLKYSYSYKNDTAKTARLKITRQMLSSKKKVVFTTSVNKNIKAGESFNRTVNQMISKYSVPGNYWIKVKVTDLTNNKTYENSFRITIEKLKKKYFMMDGVETSTGPLLFNPSSLKRIKSNRALATYVGYTYTYVNSSDKMQVIKLSSDIISPSGKVLYSRSSQVTLLSGKKALKSTSQYLGSKLAAGKYKIRIRATDWNTKKVLAENYFNFSIDLK